MKLLYLLICAVCLNLGINTSAMSACKIIERPDGTEVDCSDAGLHQEMRESKSTEDKTDEKTNRNHNNYSEMKSNLLQLLGNKEFWSTFNWESFEESELYKSAEWHPPGWSGNIGNTVLTRTNTYTTAITFEKLDIKNMTLYVRSDAKGFLSIHGTSPNESSKDYSKLVSWFDEKFGEATVKDKQTETQYQNNRDMIETYWAMGNTKIRVRHEKQTFVDGTSRNLIKLSFERNLVQNRDQKVNRVE